MVRLVDFQMTVTQVGFTALLENPQRYGGKEQKKKQRQDMIVFSRPCFSVRGSCNMPLCNKFFEVISHQSSVSLHLHMSYHNWPGWFV